MNHSRLTPEEHAELLSLIQSSLDERATPEKLARLREWVCRDEEAGRIYVRYTHLCGKLHWSPNRELESGGPIRPEGGKAQPIPPDLLSGLPQPGVNFLARGLLVLLLAAAIGLPGIVYMLLPGDGASPPVVKQSASERTEPQASQPEALRQEGSRPMAAAWITRTHDCVWSAEGKEWTIGTEFSPGQRLDLREGLAELTFADGAQLILRAPAVFEIGSGRARLCVGSVTATVPWAAIGFKIETPVATVVDLGTEFGVSVGADGTSETHVFQGRVQMVTGVTDEVPTLKQSQLLMGEGARVRPAAMEGSVSVEPILASTEQFVRRFPEPRPDRFPKRPRLIVSADRKGGAEYDGASMENLGRVRPTIAFDGETDPLKSSESGLRVGSLLYSDRPYVVTRIDEPVAGADYIRVFNTDKEKRSNLSTPCTYDVTFTTEHESVFVMVLVDDRLRRREGRQQQLVDRFVSRFAKPGEFADTGLDVHTVDHASALTLSVFGRSAPTRDAKGAPITYQFNNKMPCGLCCCVLAAMEEKPPEIGQERGKDAQ
jgi:hypothetical protein